ncbi:PDZ and LIM domain protein Zasp isoform X12 [Anastrepha ludens]|uniref:PDZ and LIM domain protein Zasp isoform X12 n=1 Tax=Anastrepha ludens TaxID=28586 RepID=UPI0023B0F45A|nr:PDZ and LIM domain protein Zasp isoform X12 [Anastrepha ludens]
MAQPQLLQIKLSRFDAQPWGFRLQGGVDFATPLVVQKVNGGSLAESAGLIPGDAVLKINDVDVYNLRHKEAQDVVVRSGNNFVLTVQRGGSTWRPHIAPTGNLPQPQQNSPYLQTVTKTSLAHKQQEGQHIGCGYNNAARPFANGGDGSVKSIVNKQYNTPVGIYSDESIAETLSAQAEVLAGGVLGVNFKKNEKEYQADKSEVLKFLREEETGHSTPEPPAPANFYWTQSHAIGGNERRTPLSHQHQQHSQQEQPQDERVEAKSLQSNAATNEPSRPGQASKEAATPAESVDPRVIIMPVCPALQGPEYKAELEAAAAALQHDAGPRPLSASGHPACALCGVGIVGVFVRIKDKNLHVECFKCATCGTSLKNQGYYNFNNKLYCDIHAKLAAMQHPPSGTEGYVPVPIKPNTKLSANTISSALNAHGFSDIPYSNGGSAKPSPVPGAQLHEWTDANKEDNTDLPLPPPPSPTLLQQLEIDSQCRGYIDDNTTDTKQQLQHTRTNSSSLSTLSNTSNSPSMSSEAHSIHNLAIVEGIEGTPPTSMAGSAVAVDEKSSGYASTTSLHSRQTSSSSSSVCGISRDADISSLSSPPPPPPLPPSLPIQMIQQPHRQQNENDMNSQNQYGNGGGLAGSGVGSKNSPSGGVYSKFLKEYSNKLLTHSNNNKTQTNPLFLDNSPNNSSNSKNSNKTIVTNNSQNRLNDTAPPYQPTTQISAVAHPQSIQNLDSTSTTTAAVAVTSSATATATAKSKTTHPSVVAAISTTPSNLLNFNPCQQVAKAATASAASPPAVSLPPPTTTAISAIINNATSLDTANSNSSSNSKSSNRCEGGQLSESENTHDAAKEITSAMLANQSSALDDSLNDQPFGEYVTLTGSVIRSVVPPGKGVNINYKVNQGYARPFGAASGPPAAAPKSPVSYAPQRPAVNPYATLPRTNIGQQGRRINTYNNYSNNYPTQFRKPISTNYGSNKYATMPVYNISKYNNSYYNQGVGGKGAFGATSAPKRGRGIFNKAVGPGVRVPLCNSCNIQIRGPFITALGRIWCPEHFICVNANCRRALQDIGFVEEKGDLYCEYCFEKYLAPTCSKCGGKIKGDCLNAIGKQFHPECFTCGHCGKLFGNTPFFLEDGNAYCEADWNELFTTKCFACGFPVEAGDRWVEALNHNYHSQCFNCTYCKQNLEGQSFYNKGGRPFCKNHAR